jgi:hypothetical protein
VIGRCGIHVFRSTADARRPCFVCAGALAISLDAPRVGRFTESDSRVQVAKRRQAREAAGRREGLSLDVMPRRRAS